jgi:nicotinic acid phosphoribosyltransferase
MNILIATGIYPPESGGPATYSYEVAAALCRQGYRVTVITYGDGGSSKKEVEKNEEFDALWCASVFGADPRHAPC